MKKIFTLLMSAITFIALQAQTVYSENMGTPAATTVITNYTGWQNSAPITYSGSGDVRTSTASTGYTGASGGGNIFLTSTAGKNLIISGINTSAYSSTGLTLSFGYLTSTTSTQLVLEQSIDGGTTWTPITFTNNSNTSWNLVSITGQIASAANLSLRFTQPVTAQMRIDDVKIVFVSTTCALTPAAPVTACAATTLGIDSYTITIPFTGGGTAAYTVTATSGTVGGANPSTTATGDIVITGTPEGTANTITITGGTCSFSIPVAAPLNGCKPINTLPLTDNFSYPVGQALTAQQMWIGVNSGDDILIGTGDLSMSGLSATGSSATFSGTGMEALTRFTSTNSGVLTASFYSTATDYSNVTTDLTNTYFALFTDDTGGSTTARVWIRKNGTKYQFGLGSGTAPDSWSANTWDTTTPTLVTLSYDFASNTLSLFENQLTPTTPSVTVTPTTAYTNLGGFMFRQDTNSTTPTLVIDALNIYTGLVLAVNDIKLVNSNFVRNTMVKDEIYFGSASDVKVFNMNSQVVKTAKVSEYKNLNVSDLNPGIYIVTGMVDGRPVSQRILKK